MDWLIFLWCKRTKEEIQWLTQWLLMCQFPVTLHSKQCCTALYCTQHCTVLNTALYWTLHCTEHCTILNTALYCTALHSKHINVQWSALHCTNPCTILLSNWMAIDLLAATNPEKVCPAALSCCPAVLLSCPAAQSYCLPATKHFRKLPDQKNILVCVWYVTFLME